MFQQGVLLSKRTMESSTFDGSNEIRNNEKVEGVIVTRDTEVCDGAALEAAKAAVEIAERAVMESEIMQMQWESCCAFCLVSWSGSKRNSPFFFF